MIRRIQTLLAVPMLVLLVSGCGNKPAGTNSPTAQTQHAAPTASGDTTPLVTPANELSVAESPATFQTPDEVVKSFLTAMRDGNQNAISGLLTQKAREETAKNKQLEIQPPGSPDSSYQVGETQYTDESKTVANVSSIWREPDAGGSSIEYEVVWVMRREIAGWRVAGMATHISDNAPLLFLNFEDPDDMLARLEKAQSASGNTQEKPPVRQAENPIRSGNQTFQR